MQQDPYTYLVDSAADYFASPPLYRIQPHEIVFEELLSTNPFGDLRKCTWNKSIATARTLRFVAPAESLSSLSSQSPPSTLTTTTTQSQSQSQTQPQISSSSVQTQSQSQFAQSQGRTQDKSTSAASTNTNANANTNLHPNAKDTKEVRKLPLREYVSILTRVRDISHPNILPIYGIVEQDQHVHVVMEYVDGGHLRALLDSTKSRLSWSLFFRYALQISCILENLHAEHSHLPYRELRSENIYIIQSCAKLADCGFFRLPEDAPSKNSLTALSVPNYSPPECFSFGSVRGRHIGEKTDVYIYAMILWEMATGQYPFHTFSPSKIMGKVTKGTRPTIPASVPKSLSDFIRLCWHQDPAKRPTFQKITQTLKSIRDSTPEFSQENSAAGHVFDPNDLPLSASSVSGVNGDASARLRRSDPIAHMADILRSSSIPEYIVRMFAKHGIDLKRFIRILPDEFTSPPFELSLFFSYRLLKLQTKLISECITEVLQEPHEKLTLPHICDIHTSLMACLEKYPTFIVNILIVREVYIHYPGLIPYPRDRDIYTDLMADIKKSDPRSRQESREFLKRLNEEAREIRVMNNSLSVVVYGNFLQHVDDNAPMAFECYKYSAEMGNSFGQYHLAACYYYGYGIDKDHAKAFSWFQKAAEQDHIYALYYQGVCYSHGHGETENLGQAYICYRKAAEYRHPYAQNNLAYCFQYNRGTARNYGDAYSWYKKASEMGNACAQYNLALCYKVGRGVDKSHEEAAKWLLKASMQGHTHAQNNLGCVYEQGRGVEKDFNKAVFWYRTAAERNNAQAQFNLGLCFEHGRGVDVDFAEAAEWYKRAAKQGDMLAQANLGDFYEEGKGVAKDRTEAIRLFKMAAARGNAYAKFALARLEGSKIVHHNARLLSAEQNAVAVRK